MNVFRTPEERFEAWADYPFEPNYTEFEGLRMHYVDEGDRGAPVVLMVHGMPTSSYLYRFVIQRMVAAGYRCIAPDHIGFGKSDKVLDDAWYSTDKHQRALAHLVQTLDLSRITAMVQDWGGPIGLRGPVDMPERYERLCILNTWLHYTGYDYNTFIRAWARVWEAHDIPGPRLKDPSPLRRLGSWALSKGFKARLGEQPCGSMVHLSMHGAGGGKQHSSATYRAYEAPFPDAASKAGPRRMPLSLPFHNPEGANSEVQEHCFNALKKWDKPAHFIFGQKDPVWQRNWFDDWSAAIPGSTLDKIPDAAHFLQETHHEEVVRILLARIAEEKGSA